LQDLAKSDGNSRIWPNLTILATCDKKIPRTLAKVLELPKSAQTPQSW
jgi:hypothetical protein